ncbi:MAG: hypothetical protein Q9160_007208 [Pyrenula sp. 1 TL-2023]
MTAFQINGPFPGILDDPNTQIVSLPSHPTLHIAPLRNPVPSRAIGVPTPLEPNAAATKDERARLGRRVPKKSKHEGGTKKSTEKPTSIQALIQPEKDPLVKLPAFVNLAAIENKLPPYRALNDRHTKRVKLDADHIQLPKIPPKEPKPPPFGPFTIVNGLHEPPPGANLLPPMDSDQEKPKNSESGNKRQESKEVDGRPKDIELRSGGSSAKRPVDSRLKEMRSEEVLKTRGSQERVSKINGGEEESKISSLEKRKGIVRDEKVPEPKHEAGSRKEKSRKYLKRWTEAETHDLLKGVTRYGVGKWKQIKEDPDLDFNDRSTVDLKDRFRVCCPDAYRSGRVEKGGKTIDVVSLIRETSQPTKSSHASRQATSSTIDKYSTALSRLKLEADKSSQSQNEPDTHDTEPKTTARRTRRRWTQSEDEKLLQGLAKHGMAWSAIQQDTTLHLSHRRPQDLRDRIRTRFPEGYKLAPPVVKTESKPREKEDKEDTEGIDKDESKEVNTEGPGLPSLTTLDGWDWDNNTLPPLWEEMGI